MSRMVRHRISQPFQLDPPFPKSLVRNVCLFNWLSFTILCALWTKPEKFEQIPQRYIELIRDVPGSWIVRNCESGKPDPPFPSWIYVSLRYYRWLSVLTPTSPSFCAKYQCYVKPIRDAPTGSWIVRNCESQAWSAWSAFFPKNLDITVDCGLLWAKL